MTLKQKWLLFSVIVLAVFFRFWQIGQMPGGLFPDEAANGLDINLMQQGHLQPFYERGNGREALFFYMIWASVEVFGKTPFAHHIVSALIGCLAVFVCFLFTRRLFLDGEDSDDEKVQRKAFYIALLAAFLMAVSTWHVTLSRTAFRANQIPLFTTLTLYFLLCIRQSLSLGKKYLYSFLCGASFALGFYTYIAYRIMVPVMFVLVLWPWFANGFVAQVKLYWKKFLLFLLAFFIFITPIGYYFLTHPGSFIGRSGQVSVFNQSLYAELGITETYSSPPPAKAVLQAVGIVAKKSILAYFTVGDKNWRHNISTLPFLPVLYSPVFGVGLLAVTILAIWYFFAPKKKPLLWKFFVLCVVFFAMLLPVISTAEGIPHGLRSIGTIPVVFIISAWALWKLHYFVHKLFEKLSIWQSPVDRTMVKFGFKITVVCFVICSILQTYFLYFVYAYNTPENFYFFRSDLTTVSSYLVDRCKKQNTYLVLDKFSVQTTDYLTSDPHGNFSSPCNVPYIQVDPEDSWKLTGLSEKDEIIFTQSSIFDTTKFQKYHPNTFMSLEKVNKFGQSVMQVYKLK